ncbi:uncharacterized protein BcabD6B2_07570 [Babesia caballi]|uniref:Uncharacterized protein n=1 Tax=Babesia caballi TaxID=5871 RepID=A0AAV4LNC2_BABCB|nr:hypothetical protein BcabD6B2_07570 [Babesia caballi]
MLSSSHVNAVILVVRHLAAGGEAGELLDLVLNVVGELGLLQRRRNKGHLRLEINSPESRSREGDHKKRSGEHPLLEDENHEFCGPCQNEANTVEVGVKVASPLVVVHLQKVAGQPEEEAGERMHDPGEHEEDEFRAALVEVNEPPLAVELGDVQVEDKLHSRADGVEEGGEPQNLRARAIAPGPARVIGKQDLEAHQAEGPEHVYHRERSDVRPESLVEPAGLREPRQIVGEQPLAAVGEVDQVHADEADELHSEPHAEGVVEDEVERDGRRPARRDAIVEVIPTSSEPHHLALA